MEDRGGEAGIRCLGVLGVPRNASDPAKQSDVKSKF